MATSPKPVSQRSDPMLDEIHAVKQAVSASVGHDVARLCRELREEQERSGGNVVRRRPAARNKRSQPI